MQIYNYRRSLLALLLLAAVGIMVTQARSTLYMSGVEDNDLYKLLKTHNIDVKLFDTPAEAVEAAPKGGSVLFTAPAYPKEPVKIDVSLLSKIYKEKNLRMFAEYVAAFPGIEIADSVYTTLLDRGVITSGFFRPQLQAMDILNINDCHVYPAKVKNPLISFARVAGFDKAEYGLTDTNVYPLLWRNGNDMLSFTCLSNFITARGEPAAAWQAVWTHILQWLTHDKNLAFSEWPMDPHPSFGRNDILPADARRNAVRKGADWLYKGKLMVHPVWMDSLYEYQGTGLSPYGKAPTQGRLTGDGCHGVLEGHGSQIKFDGTTNYRYWLRADVQGEVAFLLATAGDLLGDNKYKKHSENLLDYVFFSRDFIDGNRRTPGNDAYGLISWAVTSDSVFYNDDNARLLLGAIGASSILNENRWNQRIVDCILANFRLSSRQGFLPDRIEEQDLLQNGREYYAERDFIFPHPHFDSWMWACYLWLYDKTGYKPLLDKAETAIRLTMEAYPDNWHWTNGIQQERARMILPLAWLVRVDDTTEHREWLDTVVNRLLQNQDESGAIREELGGEGLGMFGKAKSNKEYGVSEAPLISVNGDPVADMLYTSNFAFFSLNEAAHATGNPEYKKAVDKLSDFLVRIQANSENQPDIDGAWMRAFDFSRWDYFASNADQGWGAWCTLTGWIQSWIVGTNALVEKNNSFWGLTLDHNVNKEFEAARPLLLNFPVKD